MTNTQDLVYIIVVTYNAEQWLDRCFTSLKKSHYPCKTVVVDNGSTDNTVKLIQEKFPEIKLHVSDENLGFGQGNNWGIKQALDNSVDYLFLLNQDAWVEEDTIGKLVNCANENPNYGVISPVHLNGEYSALDANFRKYITKDLSQNIVTKITEKDIESLNEIYPISFVNAAAWFIPRACIETVGGFDPIFFHYGEDFNFLSRVKYHGFNIGFCPKTTICHDRLIVEKGKEITRLNNSSLAYVSDINKSLFQVYISEIIFLCAAIFYNLFRFKPKRSKAFLSFIFQIISEFKIVKRSRNTNKVKSLNYL